ncbi:MAG: MFS transporter [Bdellovibrio sp.]|nr:MFS transporter [Bdellovibrio sp.]
MFFQVSKKTWAFAFAYLSMFALGIADNTRGPLFSDLLSAFKLSNWQGSMSFALASAAGLVGNVSSTYLFKKFNLADTLSGALFIMASGLLLMALAPDFNLYILGAIFFGYSMGLMGVTQTLMINESVQPLNQSKAMSGMHGIYGLSSLVAPLVAAQAPRFIDSWRAAFFVVAAIAFLVALSSVALKAKPNFVVHEVLQEKVDSKKPIKTLFFLGGIFAFYVVAEILVSSRLALYMRTYFQMDLEASSQYVTYFFMFLLFGRLVFALKAFRISLRRQLNISLILSLSFLILGLNVHPFFLVMTGLSMAPFYPLSITYISEQTGIYKRPFLTFAISFQSVCVISMHMGVGYLTDQFGLFYAFGVGIISLVLALVCVNFHPKVFST